MRGLFSWFLIAQHTATTHHRLLPKHGELKHGELKHGEFGTASFGPF
jgi:hypothetical protein